MHYQINNRICATLKIALDYQNELENINKENLHLSLKGEFKQIDTTITKVYTCLICEDKITANPACVECDNFVTNLTTK
jgi:hypothetical protein